MASEISVKITDVNLVGPPRASLQFILGEVSHSLTLFKDNRRTYADLTLPFCADVVVSGKEAKMPDFFEVLLGAKRHLIKMVDVMSGMFKETATELKYTNGSTVKVLLTPQDRLAPKPFARQLSSMMGSDANSMYDADADKRNVDAAAHSGVWGMLTSLEVRIFRQYNLNLGREEQMRCRVGYGKLSTRIAADKNGDYYTMMVFPTENNRSTVLTFQIYDQASNQNYAFQSLDLSAILENRDRYERNLILHSLLPKQLTTNGQHPSLHIEVSFGIARPGAVEVRKLNRPDGLTPEMPTKQVEGAAAYSINDVVPGCDLKSALFEVARITGINNSHVVPSVQLGLTVGKNFVTHEGFMEGQDPVLNAVYEMPWKREVYARFQLRNPTGDVVATCKFNMEKWVLSRKDRTLRGTLSMTDSGNHFDGRPIKIHSIVRLLGVKVESPRCSLTVGGAALTVDEDGKIKVTETKLLDEHQNVVAAPQFKTDLELAGDDDMAMSFAAPCIAAPTAGQPFEITLGNAQDAAISAFLDQALPTADEDAKANREVMRGIASARAAYKPKPTARSCEIQLNSLPQQILSLGNDAVFTISGKGVESVHTTLGELATLNSPVMQTDLASDLGFCFAVTKEGEKLAEGRLTLDSDVTNQAVLMSSASGNELGQVRVTTRVLDESVAPFRRVFKSSEQVTDNEIEGDEPIEDFRRGARSVKGTNFLGLPPKSAAMSSAGRDLNFARSDQMAELQVACEFQSMAFTCEAMDLDSTPDTSKAGIEFTWGSSSIAVAEWLDAAVKFPMDVTAYRYLSGCIVGEEDQTLGVFSVDIAALLDGRLKAMQQGKDVGRSVQVTVSVCDPDEAPNMLQTAIGGGLKRLGQMIVTVEFSHTSLAGIGWAKRCTAPRQHLTLKPEICQSISATIGANKFNQTTNNHAVIRTFIKDAEGNSVNKNDAEFVPNVVRMRVAGYKVSARNWAPPSRHREQPVDGVTFELQLGPPRKAKNAITQRSPPFECQLYEQLRKRTTFPAWASSSQRKFYDIGPLVDSHTEVTQVPNCKAAVVELVNPAGANILNTLETLNVIVYQRNTSTGLNHREVGFGHFDMVQNIVKSSTQCDTLGIQIFPTRNTNNETFGEIYVEMSFAYKAEVAAREKVQAVRM